MIFMILARAVRFVSAAGGAAKYNGEFGSRRLIVVLRRGVLRVII